MLSSLRLCEVSDGAAIIEVLDSAQLGFVRMRSAMLSEILEKAVGSPVRVEIKGEAPAVAKGPATNQPIDNPLVEQARELFDATLLSIEPDDDIPAGGAPASE